jgi:hypothetical protein
MHGYPFAEDYAGGNTPLLLLRQAGKRAQVVHVSLLTYAGVSHARADDRRSVSPQPDGALADVCRYVPR